ncbi:MAG: hypothetical protein HYR63_28970 [Proteobacteria bacterium]|nr:hypothetical protein [Pseudomonadota bacterium]
MPNDVKTPPPPVTGMGGRGLPDWLAPALLRAPELLRVIKERGFKAEKLTTGVVQALGLQDMKKQHLRQWERLKKNIHIIIEAEIQRHVQQNDLRILLDDETYLIVFADDDPERADAIARKIAREASVKLAGYEGAGEVIQVAAFIVQMNEADLVKAARSGKGSDILDAVKRVREQQEAETGPRLSYLPTLCVRKHLVCLYDVEPLLLTAQSAPQLIGKVASHMRQIASCPPVQVPLSFEILANSDALKTLADRLQQLGPDTRRRMILRITNVPEQIPPKALATLARLLRRGVLGMALDHEGRPGDDERIKAVRPLLVNVDLDVTPVGDGLLPVSFALGAALQNLGVKPRVLVRHVRAQDQIGILKRIGAAYINGKVVAPELGKVDRAFHLG